MKSVKFSNKFLRKKQPKYHNKKVTDSKGNIFDSKKEYERWITLSILQKNGHIHSLQRQVTYVLIPAYKGIQHGIRYIADFVYYENGKKIIEDCKGFHTKEYIIKKKLMYHFFKIQIKEV